MPTANTGWSSYRIVSLVDPEVVAAGGAVELELLGLPQEGSDQRAGARQQWIGSRNDQSTGIAPRR